MDEIIAQLWMLPELLLSVALGFIIGLEYGRSLYGLKDLFAAVNHDQAIIYGQTVAFLTLALSQVVQAFNMRSDKSLFKVGPFKNKYLNLSALASVALVSLVLFVPGLNTVFGLTIMPYHLYLIGLGLSFVPLLVMELAKAIGLIKHHHH